MSIHPLMKVIEEKYKRTNNLPEFNTGDTVVVSVKVIEGEKKRVQAFEGLVLGKRNRGLGSSFMVRKISHGVAVERTFQTHSPMIEKLEVVRRGKVRKSKIYYMRERFGKSARVEESFDKK